MRDVVKLNPQNDLIIEVKNMDNLEPKKLALLRIQQIFFQYSDYNHPLKQEDIAKYLERDYGILLERKAISRNISLLKESGMEIKSTRDGSYVDVRDFEDSELRMLIDGVLCSHHITPEHSKDLIERLCGLSNRYFKSHVKNIFSVNEWNKTENKELFYNIELIDEAIEQQRQLIYDYNKYGKDKRLHKSSQQIVSPYQLILHNQRYYLMAYHEYWENMAFHRLDRITNMRISDQPLTDIRSVPGYEQGIDYKRLSSAMPYMYTDVPQRVEFSADNSIIDQIVDWFGKDIEITEADNDQVTVTVTSSLMAMEHWALQYLEHVEIIKPEILRQKIQDQLAKAMKKYQR